MQRRLLRITRAQKVYRIFLTDTSVLLEASMTTPIHGTAPRAALQKVLILTATIVPFPSWLFGSPGGTRALCADCGTQRVVHGSSAAEETFP